MNHTVGDLLASLLASLLLYLGLVLCLAAAFHSLPAGVLAALLLLALKGFLRPAFGPRADRRHPLPDLLTRAWDDLLAVVDRTSCRASYWASQPYRRAVIVMDTHGHLTGYPARPLGASS